MVKLGGAEMLYVLSWLFIPFFVLVAAHAALHGWDTVKAWLANATQKRRKRRKK